MPFLYVTMSTRPFHIIIYETDLINPIVQIKAIEGLGAWKTCLKTEIRSMAVMLLPDLKIMPLPLDHTRFNGCLETSTMFLISLSQSRQFNVPPLKALCQWAPYLKMEKWLKRLGHRNLWHKPYCGQHSHLDFSMLLISTEHRGLWPYLLWEDHALHSQPCGRKKTKQNRSSQWWEESYEKNL